MGFRVCIVSLFLSPLNVICKITNSLKQGTLLGYLRESLSSVFSSVIETRPTPWMQDPEQALSRLGTVVIAMTTVCLEEGSAVGT